MDKLNLYVVKYLIYNRKLSDYVVITRQIVVPLRTNNRNIFDYQFKILQLCPFEELFVRTLMFR